MCRTRDQSSPAIPSIFPGRQLTSEVPARAREPELHANAQSLHVNARTPVRDVQRVTLLDHVEALEFLSIRMLVIYTMKRQILLTAAAALSQTSLFSHAFSIHLPPSATTQRAMRRFSPTSTSLHASKNDNSFLIKVGKSVKSFLPATWFQSEEEKKAQLERKKVQDEISGGLAEILKDAPLPIRMLGKMVEPLLSSALSGMAETFAEQQAKVESLLNEARLYLEADDNVKNELGETVQIGTPFSQSSSSSNINGKTMSRVELAFPVTGSRSSGIAQLMSTGDGIQSLKLQTGGRVIDVNRTKRRRRMPTDDDNIIEAEIIDKNTK